ncbi:hypothetical protein PR048_019128 [Dryococelus australis]|uniref:Uncharacterized protein n=1 Tax=Dryococelus australis TaxID=614101 RepID=A0ABQ9H2M3_9NEOP|nr:hypothetical protein PR048_019128 [Dryococelus australis]
MYLRIFYVGFPGELTIHVHAQIFDNIFTAYRFAKKCDLGKGATDGLRSPPYCPATASPAPDSVRVHSFTETRNWNSEILLLSGRVPLIGTRGTWPVRTECSPEQHAKQFRHCSMQVPMLTYRIPYIVKGRLPPLQVVEKRVVVHRYSLQDRKKKAISIYKDKSGVNHRNTKFTSDDRDSVRSYITSLPKDVSRYDRVKANKYYLSSDLTVSRIYKDFKTLYQDSIVTEKFFRDVFRKDFPDLAFQKLRVDTCSTCDLLSAKIATNDAESRKSNVEQAVHHRKYRKALTEMPNDHRDSNLPGCTYPVIPVDLQQVIPLPTLTHSNIFYECRAWSDGFQGNNEIVSCNFNLVNMGKLRRDKLIVWFDNC